MGKINTQDFGTSTPKLEQDDLEGDAAILTVTAFEMVEVDDDEMEGGKRKTGTLTFEETGDKVLWLNKGMVETLVEQLGDESDEWVGAKVPVEKYTARYRGQKYAKVRVVPSEEWESAFKEAGEKFTGRKRTAAPVTKKAAAKKSGGKR